MARAWMLAVALATASQAQAAEANWHLDRVAVVMRHGVRPPTKAEPLPPGMAPAPWPAWGVGWGELTAHGTRAVALLARFDRRHYAALIGPGCPATGTVRAIADSDQRTIATAEAYVAAMFPRCGVAVAHQPQGASDPMWSPGEGGTPLLPPGDAKAAAETMLPAGGTAALDAALAPQWRAIDRILACHDTACSIAARPTTVDENANGRVRLGGALATGGSFSETLALEYAEGKPLAQVGWGRVTRQDITRLLELHSAEFAVSARGPAVARAGAATLLGAIATALTAADGPAFSLYVGHDTNLALIGGALGLHWHAPQFAPDDPPPGGALIFERWSNGAGRYRLVVRFRSQSLDAMRTLAAPGPGAIQTVPFDGCTNCDPQGLRAALVR
jgi:4-phytase / acid phosphatase